MITGVIGEWYDILFNSRARKVWWGTFIAILVADNIAIGAKKLWIYRKDQLQTAQNQGAIVVNKNLHQQPQHNALQLNNARHNQDVTTWRQNVLSSCMFNLCRHDSRSLYDTISCRKEWSESRSIKVFLHLQYPVLSKGFFNACSIFWNEQTC